MMSPFKPFLSPKCPFKWSPEMDDTFKQSKEAIIKAIRCGVEIFDPTLRTCLKPDWSKVGIGYWLLQQHCDCSSGLPGCCGVACNVSWLAIPVHCRGEVCTNRGWGTRCCLGPWTNNIFQHTPISIKTAHSALAIRNSSHSWHYQSCSRRHFTTPFRESWSAWSGWRSRSRYRICNTTRWHTIDDVVMGPNCHWDC